ncbi:MAG TPA: hypothetical protein VKS81_10325, partial [Bacteroidota bacterium]|nr:hypothetical protein [Bacteroidota bacterium]
MALSRSPRRQSGHGGSPKQFPSRSASVRPAYAVRRFAALIFFGSIGIAAAYAMLGAGYTSEPVYAPKILSPFFDPGDLEFALAPADTNPPPLTDTTSHGNRLARDVLRDAADTSRHGLNDTSKVDSVEKPDTSFVVYKDSTE